MDNYIRALEFFAENGISLDSDQLYSLREEYLIESSDTKKKEMKDVFDKIYKAGKENYKNNKKEIKKYTSSVVSKEYIHDAFIKSFSIFNTIRYTPIRTVHVIGDYNYWYSDSFVTTSEPDGYRSFRLYAKHNYSPKMVVLEYKFVPKSECIIPDDVIQKFIFKESEWVPDKYFIAIYKNKLRITLKVGDREFKPKFDPFYDEIVDYCKKNHPELKVEKHNKLISDVSITFKKVKEK